MNRKVEQLPAEEVLEGLHRVLHQVGAELLNILEEFERSSDPEHGYGGVRVGVVGGSVEGARGGIPGEAEVLQEIRDPAIEEVVELGVVGSDDVVDAELIQEVLQPLREPERVITGELIIDAGVGDVSADFAIGGAGVVAGVDASAALDTV